MESNNFNGSVLFLKSVKWITFNELLINRFGKSRTINESENIPRTTVSLSSYY